MQNRTEIYRQLVRERHIIESREPIDPLVPDQARRRANVYAVKNTERVYQEQFRGEQ